MVASLVRHLGWRRFYPEGVSVRWRRGTRCGIYEPSDVLFGEDPTRNLPPLTSYIIPFPFEPECERMIKLRDSNHLLKFLFILTLSLRNFFGHKNDNSSHSVQQQATGQKETSRGDVSQDSRRKDPTADGGLGGRKPMAGSISRISERSRQDQEI